MWETCEQDFHLKHMMSSWGISHWNVLKMGLFCCCFKPKIFENERKRILEDRNDGMSDIWFFFVMYWTLSFILSKPVANVNPTEMSPSVNSLLFRTQNVCLSAQTSFEITVQKMAAKMINIPALNNEFSQMLLRDRQKAYAKRVYGIRSPLPLRSDAEKSRPKSEQTSHQKHC